MSWRQWHESPDEFLIGIPYRKWRTFCALIKVHVTENQFGLDYSTIISF
jgi:hypothetical protein